MKLTTRERRLKRFVFSFITIVILLFVFEFTGILQWQQMDGTSGKPGIDKFDLVFSTRLKKPELFSTIVYKKGYSKYILRICGMPGDTVEIRNGDLYVNGQEADHALNLWHQYQLAADQKDRIIKVLGIDIYNEPVSFSGPDAEHMDLYLFLSKKRLAKLDAAGIRYKRSISSKTIFDFSVNPIYNSSWNSDHFGPYIVPADHYFMLADNRDEFTHIDSRYTGPVPFSQFRGTILNH